MALLIGLFSLSACESELYHDLSERRANEALLALREVGVRADKRLEQRGNASRPSSFMLLVPRSEEARALTVLMARGLPRLPERAAASSSKLLFLPNTAEAHAENAAALSATVSDTLERLPEVSEARVHLALPEPEPLSPLGSLRPTAAVLLKLRAPLAVRSSELAALVARAVPGLDPQDVTVVIAPPAAPGGGAAMVGPALVAVGPLLVTPETRPIALFLLGLLVVLAILVAVLVRLAWPRRPPPRPERR